MNRQPITLRLLLMEARLPGQNSIRDVVIERVYLSDIKPLQRRVGQGFFLASSAGQSCVMRYKEQEG